MSFRCPQCLTSDSLEITDGIDHFLDRDTSAAGVGAYGYRGDSCSMGFSLQVVACSICTFRGLAIYSEGRGDYPESESWQHIGYWVSLDAVEAVSTAIRSCPDPHNPRCPCPAHAALAQHDVDGQWRGLQELERGHTFSMRLFIG
jgi:hypothetical protein